LTLEKVRVYVRACAHAHLERENLESLKTIKVTNRENPLSADTHARDINPIRLSLCESTPWIMMPETIPEQCQLISRKVFNQTEFHCNVLKILILARILNKKKVMRIIN